MSAPDFYFCVNAIARHIHDRYGKAALVTYWRELAQEYYRSRWLAWKRNGPAAIAEDWRTYFLREPQAKVTVTVQDDCTILDVQVCPAIKHLRDHQRSIVEYFCEHCDHTCGAMAEAAGYRFEREGAMGTCRQTFTKRATEGATTSC